MPTAVYARAVPVPYTIPPFVGVAVLLVPPDAIGSVPVVSAVVEFAYSAPLLTNEVMPVPPFVVAIVVPLHTPLIIVPTVTILFVPAHVERVVFSTIDNPISVLVTTDQAGVAETEPLPVCERNCLVVVVFPASKAVTPTEVCVGIDPNTPPVRLLAFKVVSLMSVV